jgi:hypothetical protein
MPTIHKSGHSCLGKGLTEVWNLARDRRTTRVSAAKQCNIVDILKALLFTQQFPRSLWRGAISLVRSRDINSPRKSFVNWSPFATISSFPGSTCPLQSVLSDEDLLGNNEFWPVDRLPRDGTADLLNANVNFEPSTFGTGEPCSSVRRFASLDKNQCFSLMA